MATAKLGRPEERERDARHAKAINVMRIADRLDQINRVNPGHCQPMEDASIYLRDYASELCSKYYISEEQSHAKT